MAAALLLTLLVILFKKRAHARRVMPPPLPYDQAIAALDRLRSQVGDLTPNQLGLQISNIIKGYFYHRYGDPLLFETSEELVHRGQSLSKHRIPEPRRAALEEYRTQFEEVLGGIRAELG